MQRLSWVSGTRAAAIGIMAGFGLAASAHGSTDTVFFADLFNPDFSAGSVRMIDLARRSPETLVPTGGGLRSVAVDVAGGKVYWCDVDNYQIARSNLDGSNVEAIVTSGLVFPSAIALDLVNGKLYWGDQADKSQAIWRVNLDGSNPEFVISTGFHRGLAVDNVNNKIYWSTSITLSRGAIWRADLDGSRPEQVVSSLDLEFKPNAIALDVKGGKIYWTDYVIDVLSRANIADGSDIETLFVAPFNNNPRGIDLDLVNGKVYWGQDIGIITDDGKIMRMNLDGSLQENVLFGVGLVNSVDFVTLPDVQPCTGDIDGNGSVEAADLGTLLGAWGLCPNCELIACPADLNQDCAVNAEDLAIMLGAWGPC